MGTRAPDRKRANANARKNFFSVHSSHILSTFSPLAKILDTAPILFASCSRGLTEHFLSLGQLSISHSKSTRGRQTSHSYNGEIIQNGHRVLCNTSKCSYELHEQLSNGTQHCKTYRWPTNGGHLGWPKLGIFQKHDFWISHQKLGFKNFWTPPPHR